MIRYSLKCEAGHGFDSWFQNAGAFASLEATGKLACPLCGTAKVEKELMAPNVQPTRQVGKGQDGPALSPTGPTLSEPQSEIETAIAALRKQITANSEYVGLNFATEARRIHEGAAPERAIYGEARPEDARSMIEDGLPVTPLPFLPTRKVN